MSEPHFVHLPSEALGRAADEQDVDSFVVEGAEDARDGREALVVFEVSEDHDELELVDVDEGVVDPADLEAVHPDRLVFDVFDQVLLTRSLP